MYTRLDYLELMKLEKDRVVMFPLVTHFKAHCYAFNQIIV